MAPFKLKFRMGSGSRSISQEIEEPVQQPLLMRQSAVNGSNTTLNSMSTNNDQHNLLPNKFDDETGKHQRMSELMHIVVHIQYDKNLKMLSTSTRLCNHWTEVHRLCSVFVMSATHVYLWSLMSSRISSCFQLNQLMKLQSRTLFLIALA